MHVGQRKWKSAFYQQQIGVVTVHKSPICNAKRDHARSNWQLQLTCIYIYIHTTAIVGFGLLSLSIGKGILLLGDVGMLNSWHVEHILEYYYLLPSGLGQNTSNQGFFCKALPTENMPRFFLLLHVETCLYLDMVPAMSI